MTETITGSGCNSQLFSSPSLILDTPQQSVMCISGVLLCSLELPHIRMLSLSYAACVVAPRKKMVCPLLFRHFVFISVAQTTNKNSNVMINLIQIDSLGEFNGVAAQWGTK